jgi:hypothetical protein
MAGRGVGVLTPSPQAVKLSAMKRLIVPVLLWALSPFPAQAAAQPQPRGCFTRGEHTAEEMVRYGLRLREGARACNAAPWYAGTQSLWDQVDKKFGAQFAAQTKTRKAAFVREFTDDAENRLGQWNGRIVMMYRNYPLSPELCDEIKTSLEGMLSKGWNSFARQAVKSKDDVKMDYRVCGQ